MIVPALVPDDLDELAGLLPHLSLKDEERRAVLLENGSRDINAAPGSGKTTILAAKLLLLARRWPHAKQGICVISHTNVARDEIRNRLSATQDGARLLAHPHFIGTIHAFVNQFLALPLLRSEGRQVDSIDDDIFESKALGLALRNRSLRYWMEKDASVQPMVSSLIYSGEDLLLTSEYGSLPKPSAKTYPVFQEIKQTLTDCGIFRHADMFAYAERLLAKHPYVSRLLSLRFPLVFIDEMQDTSWDQEALLNRAFDDSVVMQRLGDVNQRILSSDAGSARLTFPRAGCLNISTSKRFGPTIGRIVSTVQLEGTPVVGEGQEIHVPILLRYSTERVAEVLPIFGQLVLGLIDEKDVRLGDVRALCARKQSGASSAPGRHLGDYWPPYEQAFARDRTKGKGVWSLLDLTSSSLSIPDRAAAVRNAILRVLQSTQSRVITNVRNGNQLMRVLGAIEGDVRPLQRLVRDLVIGTEPLASAAARDRTVSTMYAALEKYIPEGMAEQTFRQLSVFSDSDFQEDDTSQSRRCTVDADGVKLDIKLGTIASMKGETHLATLVLESFGGQSKRYDLAEALPVIAGASDLPRKMSETLKGQFRNLYVAMSRPSSLLCLAANRERVADETVDKLVRAGWRVIDLE